MFSEALDFSGLTKFSQRVTLVRSWEDRNLPLSQSRIAFDLLTLIALFADLNKPLTLKTLFNSLKYSERGIRYVLEQFVDGGWCEIVGHEQDRRFRMVVATPRLTDAYAEYERHVRETFRDLYLCES